MWQASLSMFALYNGPMESTSLTAVEFLPHLQVTRQNMLFRLSAKSLVQLIAALAFVLAGAQFSHAHEFNLEPTHVHAHHADQHDHGIDAAHTETSGGMHCGAHILPLVSEYLVSHIALSPTYTRHSPILALKNSPGFDTPPPRV